MLIPIIFLLSNLQFTWVKESDIIEQFDPEEDPDESNVGSITKKRRNTRDHRLNPQTEKLRHKAIEEGRWALEEFEMQLNDTCGDMFLEEDDEEEEEGYTYDVLCQSDDEDGEKATRALGDQGAEEQTMAEIEEIVELLSTEGMLDYSISGRKLSKKRIAALKKRKTEKEKAAQKKKKAEVEKKKKQAKAEMAKKKKSAASSSKKGKPKMSRQKGQESKKELKELEKRRKKRGRERERFHKDEARKSKKARLSSSASRKRAGMFIDKRGRATTLVRGYLTRIAKTENLLGYGGQSAPPASAIESTSLLGMALAFRASAGYVDISSGKGEETVTKPWDRIDTDAPAKSEDRCKLLEQQAKLMEDEIARLGQENVMRLKLIEEAHSRREANEQKFIAAEEQIKKSGEFKKKSKAKKPGDGGGKDGGGKDGGGKDGGGKNSDTDAAKAKEEPGDASVAPATVNVDDIFA